MDQDAVQDMNIWLTKRQALAEMWAAANAEYFKKCREREALAGPPPPRKRSRTVRQAATPKSFPSHAPTETAPAETEPRP